MISEKEAYARFSKVILRKVRRLGEKHRDAIDDRDYKQAEKLRKVQDCLIILCLIVLDVELSQMG
jgi:hypothetical protein